MAKLLFVYRLLVYSWTLMHLHILQQHLSRDMRLDDERHVLTCKVLHDQRRQPALILARAPKKAQTKMPWTESRQRI